MAAELKLFYGSGVKSSNAYSGQPRKSVGGIITSIEIPAALRNLFGSVSLKMLSEGSEDFRCVFMKNTDTGSEAITLLKFYADVPLLASVTDPADLSPAPIDGEQWIVPAGAKVF